MAGKVAGVFPGQGSQEEGMGTALAASFDEAAEILSRADRRSDLPLAKLMREGPAERLAETAVTQPCILTVSWMAHEAVRARHGIEFDAYAGLSTGEYVALMAAEALSFEEALDLVHVRGQAMQEAAEAAEGTMVALFGADPETANRLCEEVAQGEMLQVASINGPQTVIAGETAACERARERADEHGIPRADRLEVGAAFHTADMEPARDRLARALDEVDLKRPQRPVYANVTGEPVESPAEIRRLLLRHLTEPARWGPTVETMVADGIDEFVEMGPGDTLQSFIKRIDRGVGIRSVSTAEDVEALSADEIRPA